MARKHLKRLAAPSSWGILRKAETFITRPNPGAHTLDKCIPLGLLLRKLGLVSTSREAKKALLASPVLIDGKRRVDPKAQAGLFDVVTVADKHWRISIDEKGHLVLANVPAGEIGIEPCKVTGKTPIKGGKIQVTTLDGRSILTDAKTKLAVGDTIIVTTPKQTIKEHLPLETGAFVFLIGGKHLGDKGVVASIKGSAIAYKSKDGKEYTTLKEYAFVLGKGKAAITIP